MCEVLDRIENKGRETQARESAQNFYRMGICVEDIAKGIGYPVETVKRWLKLLPA